MKKVFLFLLAGVMVLSGCASIIHGTTQNVGFASEPAGAQVTVDNHAVCTTPCIASLKRKDNHIVKMDLNGYQEFEATLTRRASGWVLGNILVGGLIGLGVDAVDGAMYKVTPAHLTATLVKTQAVALANGTAK